MIVDGKVDAFVGLGGNFLRAVPDRDVMEKNWPRMRLTVQIATKLNRSHLVNGEVALLLPCLSRIEHHVENGVEQIVSTEDSTACIHRSRGMQAPASEQLLSEPAIFAGIAPMDNPRIAAVVAVDAPQGGDYYGGEVAAPVFARVMSDALRLLNVRPELAVKTADSPAVASKHAHIARRWSPWTGKTPAP